MSEQKQTERPFHPGTPWGLFRFDTPDDAGAAAAAGDPAAAGEGADDGRPDWLPERFKTVDDFVSSYEHAQSKIGEQNQVIGELRQQVTAIQESIQQQSQQHQQHDIEEQLIEALESGDGRQQLATMAWLAAEAARMHAAQMQPQQPAVPQSNADILAFAAEQTLSARYQDWGEYADDIGKLVAEHNLSIPPDATLEQVVAGREWLYKLARAERFEREQAASQQQGQQAKLAAQTMGGAGVRPATMTDDEAYAARIRAAGGGSYAG